MTVNADLDDRLLDVLRAAASRPDLTYTREPVPLTGGFSAELLAFSLADPPPGWPRDLVARVMPDPGLARKETIVQTAVSAAGYRTPAVRASGGPDDGLGRAFMVMDRASGAPLLPGLSGASTVAAILRQAPRIPEALASAMAALHALDPRPVRDQFASSGDVPTLGGMLDYLRDAAARCQRDDLARAAQWLIDHPRRPEPEVICHGDLHPFNVLAAAGQVTVVDWTACLLAPRAYDVAFTVSMLSEPPLDVPAPLRSLARRAGRLIARRFVRRYEAHAGARIGRDDLRWHRAVISLRSLTEVAGWVHDAVIGERSGHPWLTSGQALAGHLTAVTGIAVRPRLTACTPHSCTSTGPSSLDRRAYSRGPDEDGRNRCRPRAKHGQALAGGVHVRVMPSDDAEDDHGGKAGDQGAEPEDEVPPLQASVVPQLVIRHVNQSLGRLGILRVPCQCLLYCRH